MVVRIAVLILLVFSHFSIWTENIAEAQSAQPLRIGFKAGSHVALVKGTLQGRQQQEYVTEIQHGHSVTLALAGDPRDELKVRLRNPQNMDLALSDAGSHRWTATVTESGDYEIWVVRVRNAPGKSSYKLRITIR
jgi:hypothetical protein